ncbi:unnamed protein product [Vitrella brassicaformis CCMP3155]|uniref:F-box domain-containing protein n=1 Tax=Vitrella brassicaformis (strain CCMP3155) TaxID=1169540 RepID=A0A0G4EUN0_VITBC|nr:unnamed protein product [Vitrella brassicaformis CCMP3155]|eukprot:CEM02026.1 unnamed protein product [Vitrella brassicaformis CCMP3155]
MLLGDGDGAEDPPQQTAQQQSNVSLPLWKVPPDTLSTILSPLLCTQFIIGTLSLVRKAFTTIANDPSTHHHVRIQTVKPIHLTDTQLRVWCLRLSKTKRAVITCPMTESMVRLVEGMRNTLTFLEMNEPASRLCTPFPGGCQMSERDRWWTFRCLARSLVSLSIRDGDVTPQSSFAEGGFGVWWSFGSCLRSLEYNDSGCTAYGVLLDELPAT